MDFEFLGAERSLLFVILHEFLKLLKIRAVSGLVLLDDFAVLEFLLAGHLQLVIDRLFQGLQCVFGERRLVRILRVRALVEVMKRGREFVERSRVGRLTARDLTYSAS